jgi:hypothetical protein
MYIIYIKSNEIVIYLKIHLFIYLINKFLYYYNVAHEFSII